MKQRIWITIATYIAYCINKELYKAIEYLKVQVEVLIEQQEKQNKRILLTTRQRMRIAAKAKRLSRKMLEHCTVLFTPDTVMRWYNKLIARKYDGSEQRGKPGRPQNGEYIERRVRFQVGNRPRGRVVVSDGRVAAVQAEADDIVQGAFALGPKVHGTNPY